MSKHNVLLVLCFDWRFVVFNWITHSFRMLSVHFASLNAPGVVDHSSVMNAENTDLAATQ
jgi:hypothetical protein